MQIKSIAAHLTPVTLLSVRTVTQAVRAHALLTLFFFLAVFPLPAVRAPTVANSKMDFFSFLSVIALLLYAFLSAIWHNFALQFFSCFFCSSGPLNYSAHCGYFHVCVCLCGFVWPIIEPCRFRPGWLMGTRLSTKCQHFVLFKYGQAQFTVDNSRLLSNSNFSYVGHNLCVGVWVVFHFKLVMNTSRHSLWSLWKVLTVE